MPAFEYPVLKDPKRSIRLLRIIPSSTPSRIECLIRSCLLGKSQPFSAVSYTWGHDHSTSVIVLNGKPFPAPLTIRDFLCQMLQNEKWSRRWFWIDSVCINQQDTIERNIQVSIMRQVYATAENVVVWLGPATEETNLVMDYITRHSSTISPNKTTGWKYSQTKLQSLHYIWNSKEAKAFLMLCRIPYWTRVWIVQEIMFARHLFLFCGAKKVQWRMIDDIFLHLKSIQVMGWFHMHPYGTEVLQSEAGVIFEEKRLWGNDPSNREIGIPITTLIQSYTHLQSTEKLDKVYALVGLSSDNIIIDYSVGITELHNTILELACRSQLPTRPAKDSFAKVLLAALDLSHNHQLLSVEDIMFNIMDRRPKTPGPLEQRSFLASIRYAQPWSYLDSPELTAPEAEITTPPRASGRCGGSPARRTLSLGDLPRRSSGLYDPRGPSYWGGPSRVKGRMAAD